MKNILTSLALSSLLILASCKKNEVEPSTNTSANTANTCPNPALLFSLELNDTIIDNSCSKQTVTNFGANFTADRNNVTSKALNFDGFSYLNYPNSNSLHPSLPFTISFWVNVNDSSDWAHNYFMQSNIRPNGGYCGYLIRSLANGAIKITIGDTTNNTTIDASSSVILNSNTWIHYTAVVKGNNDVDLYFNGVKDNAATVTGTGTKITYPATSSITEVGLIGGVHFSANNGRLKGKMDKIKIWNKALLGTEVLSEYNDIN